MEDEKIKKFTKLSWELLEQRCRYYQLDDPILEDHAYDKLEREYEALAKELNLEPSASNMVGFDLKRPSCAVVLEKLKRRKNNELITRD